MRDFQSPPLCWPVPILNHATVFDAIDAEIAGSARARVLIDGGECGSPAPVTILEARNLIQDSNAPDDSREVACAAIVRHAQQDPLTWERALLWTMVPRLRGIAARLRRRWRVDPDDIRSDVILAFLETVRQADPGRSHLNSYLWWTTYRRARQSCRSATPEIPMADLQQLPDREAVRRPVVSDVIEGDARTVEGVRLGSLASRLGLREIVAAPIADGGSDGGSGEAA